MLNLVFRFLGSYPKKLTSTKISFQYGHEYLILNYHLYLVHASFYLVIALE